MSCLATVRYASLRTDLANIPNELASMLFHSNTPVQDVVLELVLESNIRKQQRIYVGWSGLTSNQQGEIELDPAFAQNARISAGQKISISVHTRGPIAHTIWLEPLTVADWEIVETHAGFVENWMINQVRAVTTSHPVTLFMSSTAIACLSVSKIVPDPGTYKYARLSPDAEVIVAPRVKSKPTEPEEVALGNDKQTSESSSKPIVLRAVSAPWARAVLQGRDSTYDTLTRDLVLYGSHPELRTAEFISVVAIAPHYGNKGIQPDHKDASKPEPLEAAPVVYAKYINIDTEGVQNLPEAWPPSPAAISFGLSCALQHPGAIGLVLQVKALPKPTGKPQLVTLHPYVIDSAATVDAIHLDPNDAGPLLGIDFVFRGQVVPPIDDILPHGGIFDCEWGNAPAILGTVSVKDALVQGASRVLPKSATDLEKKPERPFVGREKEEQQVLQALLEGQSVLVHGTKQSGKTSFCNSVCEQLCQYGVSVLNLSVKNIAERPISSVRESLEAVFSSAAWQAPAVIMLEDLDLLVPADNEGTDSTRGRQTAEILRNLAENITSKRPVSILATAGGPDTIQKLLLDTFVISEFMSLSAPGREVREKIFASALAQNDLSISTSFDILDVVAETEGFQPGDLWTLADRIRTVMILKEIETQETLTAVDAKIFTEALSDFTPSGLRGANLTKSTVKWADIGGMNEPKQIILETLYWPTKYAPIFAKCPLRLRSGLLLYGYPGCGKTMLANAVASKTGLNFITVKGPEILNKYIGASEQSVRELFERAQAAKPCVLFFDEFDSIAPKRGHDSTGVTDRVVNQMLTQMDGAEGLEGVYVMAATSRPDLIDSALLRPGRLDKSILCDMPSREDRKEIIEQAKGRMHFHEDVQFDKILDQTDHYSGADVQAILTNAYLAAIHDVIDEQAAQTTPVPTENGRTEDRISLKVISGQTDTKSLEGLSELLRLDGTDSSGASATGAPEPVPEVLVRGSHIEKSLRETKPSISAKEYQKLHQIYQSFASDRDGELPDGAPSSEIGGRVTLQ